MKLALVDDFARALVVGDAAVDVCGAVQGLEAGAPQDVMARIIDRLGELRRRPLARAAAASRDLSEQGAPGVQIPLPGAPRSASGHNPKVAG